MLHVAESEDPNIPGSPIMYVTPEQLRELAYDLERAKEGYVDYMDKSSGTLFILDSRVQP